MLMAIDIYHPPAGAFWGAFNERVVVERSVDGLVWQRLSPTSLYISMIVPGAHQQIQPFSPV